MTKPKRLARITIYENPWLNLYADQVALPSGRIDRELSRFESRATLANHEFDRNDGFTLAGLLFYLPRS